MKSKLRPLGAKFDGKSRVSNKTYRKNWNEIFKKNLEGSVINLEESFTSKDFYDEKQKREKAEDELEKLKAELAREKEDREYDGLVHKRELADLFKGKYEKE